MSELLRDVRFGFRLLAKSPVFAATAVILLAVGISANTLIFSMVNALLLRPCRCRIRKISCSWSRSILPVL
jgi:putative ABC transport system permease protein